MSNESSNNPPLFAPNIVLSKSPSTSSISSNVEQSPHRNRSPREERNSSNSPIMPVASLARPDKSSIRSRSTNPSLARTKSSSLMSSGPTSDTMNDFFSSRMNKKVDITKTSSGRFKKPQRSSTPNPRYSGSGNSDRFREDHRDRDRDRDGFRSNFKYGNSGPLGSAFDTRSRGYDNRKRPTTKQHQEYSENELFAVKAKTQDINADFYDQCDVEVSGEAIAPPYESIEDFVDVSCQILKDNIKRCRFGTLTPVQSNAMPIVTSGRDIMCSAPTGSGKTFSFLAPLINNIASGRWENIPPNFDPERRKYRSAANPSVIILSPTRELASQIYLESLRLLFSRRRRREVRSVVAYGGVAINFQQNDLQRGCDILICCPGRLIDLLNRGFVNFSKLRAVVLDEADRQLDMGFRPQINEIFGYIHDQAELPTKYSRDNSYNDDIQVIEYGTQVLMFSATFPQVVQELAGKLLSDYVFLTVGHVGQSLNNITQKLVNISPQEKHQHLLDLLDVFFPQKDQLQELNWRSNKVEEGDPVEVKVLVFVETKRDAEALHDSVEDAGYHCLVIHGDRDQQQRELAMEEFRRRPRCVLIGTDVLSRGLDVPNVSHVINYDMPNDIDTYTHRIGRSGRMGAQGQATSFITYDDSRIFNDLYKHLETSGNNIPDWFTKMLPRRGGRGGRNSHRRDVRRNNNKGGNKGKRQNQGSSSGSTSFNFRDRESSNSKRSNNNISSKPSNKGPSNFQSLNNNQEEWTW
ncbi:hypothetical protein PCE1_003063 [Barthelona sp. PCE]